MASQVDGTVPVAGSPTTVSVKNNFAAARDELSCYLRTSKDFATTSGTNVAYVATFGTTVTKTAGERVVVKAHIGNNNNATININSTGAAPILVHGGDSAEGGMIESGMYAELMWSSADNGWELLNPFPRSASRFTNAKTISLTGDITGSVSTSFNSNATIATTLADSAGLKAYPVGAIYITTTTENPATTFGGGTWVSFGGGKVLVGTAQGFNIGATGGNQNHTLTAEQSGLPAHSHTQRGGGFNGNIGMEAGSNRNSSLGETSDSQPQDAAESFSLMQPYIVVAMWKRTS
jgi:hypothetical protein